jgi:hypothetical protein
MVLRNLSLCSTHYVLRREDLSSSAGTAPPLSISILDESEQIHVLAALSPRIDFWKPWDNGGKASNLLLSIVFSSHRLMCIWVVYTIFLTLSSVFFPEDGRRKFSTCVVTPPSMVGSPLWSSGQSSWPQFQRNGLDSRRYQIFWVVGLERGHSASWVQVRSYLKQKVAAPV